MSEYSRTTGASDVRHPKQAGQQQFQFESEIETDGQSLLGGPFVDALGCNLRPVLAGLVAKGAAAGFLSDLFDCPADALHAAAEAMDLPSLSRKPWRRGPVATRWLAEPTRRLILDWVAHVRVRPIAEGQGRKPGAIYAKVRQLGLPARARADLRDAPLPAPVPVVADTLVQPDPGVVLSPAWDAPSPFAAEPELPAAPEAVLVADPGPQPAPSAPALSGRKVKCPVPDNLRGFETPADIRAYLNLLDRNIRTGITLRLKNSLRGAALEEAVQEVHVSLVMWLLQRNEAGVERWTTYDPAFGLEYWAFVVNQIKYKVGEFWKAHRRRQDAERMTDYLESDAEFEALVQADGGAALAMQPVAMDVADVIDLNTFEGLLLKAARFSADHDAPNAKMLAKLHPLYVMVSQRRDPGEIRAALGGTRHHVRAWMNNLQAAAQAFRDHGAAAMMSGFGVPA